MLPLSPTEHAGRGATAAPATPGGATVLIGGSGHQVRKPAGLSPSSRAPVLRPTAGLSNVHRLLAQPLGLNSPVNGSSFMGTETTKAASTATSVRGVGASAASPSGPPGDRPPSHSGPFGGLTPPTAPPEKPSPSPGSSTLVPMMWPTTSTQQHLHSSATPSPLNPATPADLDEVSSVSSSRASSYSGSSRGGSTSPAGPSRGSATGSSSRASSLDEPGRRRKKSSRSLHIGFDDVERRVNQPVSGSLLGDRTNQFSAARSGGGSRSSEGGVVRGAAASVNRCSIDIECEHEAEGLWVMKDFRDLFIALSSRNQAKSMSQVRGKSSREQQTSTGGNLQAGVVVDHSTSIGPPTTSIGGKTGEQHSKASRGAEEPNSGSARPSSDTSAATGMHVNGKTLDSWHHPECQEP